MSYRRSARGGPASLSRCRLRLLDGIGKSDLLLRSYVIDGSSQPTFGTASARQNVRASKPRRMSSSARRTSARSRSGSVPVLANTWPQTASGGRRLRDDWVHRKKASVDCEQLVAAAAQIHLVTENHSPAAIHLSNLRTVLPAREDSLLASYFYDAGNAPVATARRAAAALSYPFDSSTTSFCAPAKVRGILSFRSILRRFLLRKRQRTAGDVPSPIKRQHIAPRGPRSVCAAKGQCTARTSSFRMCPNIDRRAQ